jgi:mRNA-degrading endonuclease RelE of RelBE toxin-antitoxin system
LSLYSVEYDPRTEAELRKLPIRLRRRIDQQLEFLRAAPFRSHPGVTVKATAGVLGVWHFHASRVVRVHYATIGPVLWVVMVERSPGVTRRSIRELRKRM